MSKGNLAAGVVRILDVNANRATEGLRVVEEQIRFQLEDRLLSARCKKIRHEVSKTVAGLVSDDERAASRSTETDVGTGVKTDSEYIRADSDAVVRANLKRAAESLRVLEEYSKQSSAAVAARFETLRYEVYTLEKAIAHLCRATVRLEQSLLYVLIDEGRGFGSDFWTRCERLCESAVDIVQLRAKQTSDREVLRVATRLSQHCREANKVFVVNDRPDIARLAGAHAVHVGQDELSVAQARSIVGPNVLVGVSTHSLDQAQRAVLDGADYLGVGPVYPSSTKQFHEYVGPQLVRDVSEQISLPCFAIGGIDESRLAEVISAGAKRVAVSQAIWHATDLLRAAETMKTELLRANDLHS